MKSGDALAVRREGAVLTMTVARPDRLNAVTAEVLNDLADLLDEAAADDAVRAVVLTGEGRAFSSGADLGTDDVMNGPGYWPGTDTILAANRVARSLRGMPQPTLAALNGPAVGVGCSLALGCDVVIAAESAYFFLVFTNIGLMPDGGATALVPASVGRSRALQMALLPERISAAKALEWGMVSRVVPNADLAAAASAITDRWVAGAPRALAATKRAVNDLTLGGLDDALEAEFIAQSDLLNGADFREARAAFAEKRPPRFTGA